MVSIGTLWHILLIRRTAEHEASPLSAIRRASSQGHSAGQQIRPWQSAQGVR
jgi:hypothetical protein